MHSAHRSSSLTSRVWQAPRRTRVPVRPLEDRKVPQSSAPPPVAASTSGSSSAAPVSVKPSAVARAQSVGHHLPVRSGTVAARLAMFSQGASNPSQPSWVRPSGAGSSSSSSSGHTSRHKNPPVKARVRAVHFRQRSKVMEDHFPRRPPAPRALVRARKKQSRDDLPVFRCLFRCPTLVISSRFLFFCFGFCCVRPKGKRMAVFGKGDKSRCGVCGQPFSDPTSTVDTGNVAYHIQCFHCAMCKRRLQKKCLNIGDKPYCSGCGRKAFVQFYSRMRGHTTV